jgi:daunorubicin resistance ABC transporter ATP-binding subunit
MDDPIIITEGLTRDFGEVHALKSVDLQVAKGSVFGLLGPNGAGKTTAVRILTTLLDPTAGHASVAGLDVHKDAERLRGEIGLAGQSAAVEENLTGLENLEMVGRLYHLGKAEAKRRSREVLERFGLAQAGDRPARTYSGGMRRRLDLGASLVGRPRVLFLDEPTSGLDPRSRLDLWAMIRELQSEGITLLLTTQYLEEADILTDRIAVIDLGSVIAEGTSDQLKDMIGGEVLEMRVADTATTGTAAQALTGVGTAPAVVDNKTGSIKIPAGTEGSTLLVDVVRRLDDVNVRLSDLALHRPTLDDVFLSLTGHAAEEDRLDDENTGAKRKRRKDKGSDKDSGAAA